MAISFYLGSRRQMRVSLGIQFEPRDLWVGAYWEWHDLGAIQSFTVYICVLPMLPLRLYIGHVSVPE